MKGLIEKIFGTHSEREIKIEGIVNDIEDLASKMEHFQMKN